MSWRPAEADLRILAAIERLGPRVTNVALGDAVGLSGWVVGDRLLTLVRQGLVETEGTGRWRRLCLAGTAGPRERDQRGLNSKPRAEGSGARGPAASPIPRARSRCSRSRRCSGDRWVIRSSIPLTGQPPPPGPTRTPAQAAP